MRIEDFDDDQKEELDRLMAHFGSQEDLHPELQAHYRDDTMMPMVHHPLVVSVAMPTMNKNLNQMFAQKQEQIKEAIAEGNWSRYIFLHERPYRFQALFDAIGRGLTEKPKDYWRMVGQVWTDSENIHQHLREWIKVWSMPVPNRELVMDEEERSALAAMPEQITVYRGVMAKRFQQGLSWTLDKDRAQWFANRFAHDGRKPHVYEGVVAKSDVLAHFLGRNEDEIVVLPRNVKNIKLVA